MAARPSNLGQQWPEAKHPSKDRDVVNFDTTLG
jgi:hypothetical protein